MLKFRVEHDKEKLQYWLVIQHQPDMDGVTCETPLLLTFSDFVRLRYAVNHVEGEEPTNKEQQCT